MPKCKHCSVIFDGPYRQKFCSLNCQFLSKVPKGLSDAECWEWMAGKTKAGYGVVNTGKGFLFAHRISHEMFIGQIPEGYFVCHKCDNPACVNPSHLFSGTSADNSADMASKGRAAWKNKKMPKEVRDKINDSRKRNGWKPTKEQISASIVARAEKMKDPEWKAAVYKKIKETKAAKIVASSQHAPRNQLDKMQQ